MLEDSQPSRGDQVQPRARARDASLRRAGGGGVRRGARLRRPGRASGQRADPSIPAGAATRWPWACATASPTASTPRPTGSSPPTRTRSRAASRSRSGAGGAAPESSVADLIDAGDAGPVTEAAFGAVRALGYLAIALAAGGLAFVLAVWRPALGAARGRATAGTPPAPPSPHAREPSGSAAAAVGVLSSALGLVLQGATAGATSFWGALDLDVLGDVIGTRFGTVWSLRLVAFAALGHADRRCPRSARAPRAGRLAARGARGLPVPHARAGRPRVHGRPEGPARAGQLLARERDVRVGRRCGHAAAGGARGHPAARTAGAHPAARRRRDALLDGRDLRGRGPGGQRRARRRSRSSSRSRISSTRHSAARCWPRSRCSSLLLALGAWNSSAPGPDSRGSRSATSRPAEPGRCCAGRCGPRRC